MSALAPVNVESPISQRHWLVNLCKHSLLNCVKPPAKASVPQNIQLVAYRLTNTHLSQGGRLGSRASVDLIHKAVQERAIDQGLFCFWCHLAAQECCCLSGVLNILTFHPFRAPSVDPCQSHKLIGELQGLALISSRHMKPLASPKKTPPSLIRRILQGCAAKWRS